MGLGAALPLKQRSSSSTATLAPALQQQQKPQRDRRPAAYHPRSEPPEAEQLAGGTAPLARRQTPTTSRTVALRQVERPSSGRTVRSKRPDSRCSIPSTSAWKRRP